MNEETLGRPYPPLLLISVRSIGEAVEAVEGGADIVDVKEPASGPLGRADEQTISDIAEGTGLLGRVPRTAALGELSEFDGCDLDDFSLPADLWLVKVGLAGERTRSDWPNRFRRLEGHSRDACLIPVAYADAELAQAPPIDEVLKSAEALGAPILLIDTWAKDGRRLWDWIDPPEIARLVGECRRAGMGLAVAGSLTMDCLDRFVDPLPRVIALRGAACEGGNRQARVNRHLVAQLKERIARLGGGQFAAAPLAPVPRGEGLG